MNPDEMTYEEIYAEAMRWAQGKKSTWNEFLSYADGSEDFSVRETAIRQSMTADALIANTWATLAACKQQEVQ